MPYYDLQSDDMAISSPTDMCIITTYRCPMQCKMCSIWQNPTEKSKEIQIKELEKLPKVKFVNLTGGEPFVREDLEEIVAEISTGSDFHIRMV